MRISLVSHGFPPLERTGVENYTAALAAALVREGHAVEVFAPRTALELPTLSMRREERGGYGITWLTTNTPPRSQEEALDVPGVADRFGEFLDRDRPEIVHFQHLIKLGMGLPGKAAERGIPTVLTAHDYYSVCHRFTLMRPDLRRCDVIGDPDACARCDLAVSFLNRHDELGDYQLGALPEQLGQDFAALESILAGDPGPAGFSQEELLGFVERRIALDERRKECLLGIDLVISPTRFLADRLAEGGLDPSRIEVLTYGAETANLERLPPPERRTDRPLRFGYLGGLSKHKGVHVLIAAFRKLDGRAELSIWGDSSDFHYVESMRELARAAGIRWRGPYRRGELASCLGEIDVVVVPSIWVENYPFVIREAFGAHRPVIVSDVGALPESVDHEVDGLRFAPGDADALAAAMRRFIDEEGLLERLTAGVKPVKGIAEQARELVEVYARLVDPHGDVDELDLPTHLVRHGARYAELTRLPSRELFRDVLSRLGGVRSMLLGTEEEGSAISAEALAGEPKAQILLRDLRREKDWLRDSVRGQEKTVEALRDKLEWREGELETRVREVEWLRETLENTQQGIDALKRENEWLRSVVSGKDEEISWLRDSLSSKETESKWQASEIENLRREIEWLRDTLIAYEHDLAWYQEKRRTLEKKLERSEGKIQELDADVATQTEKLRQGLAALSKLARNTREIQEQVFGDHVGPLIEGLEEGPEAGLEELTAAILSGNHKLFLMLAELAERRREMHEAAVLANRRIARLFVRPTGLGRRVASWREDERRELRERGDAR